MKTKIYLSSVLLMLMLLISMSNQAAQISGSQNQTGEKVIYCSPSIFGLATEWQSQYNLENPGKRIDVAEVDQNLPVFSANGSIGFITKSEFDQSKANWSIVVGRSVAVPVMNSKSPFMLSVLKTGISPKNLLKCVTDGNQSSWGTLTGTESKVPVNIYIVNDPFVKAAVADFIKVKNLPAERIIYVNDSEILTSLKSDLNSIGFCRVNTLGDAKASDMAESIKLVPIDRNNNGILDAKEDIYSDINQMLRGVWIGKYPKALCENIYAVSSEAPNDENSLAFLKWVLVSGQKYLNRYGYTDLVDSEMQSQMDVVSLASVTIPASKNPANYLAYALLILAVLMILIFVISLTFRYFRNRNVIPLEKSAEGEISFNEKSLEVPGGLYYDKTHTWAFMEKNGLVTVGVDDFLQHVTGPVSRIIMKATGEKIKKGEKLLSLVQNGKQLDLYAPVSGTIRKQNDRLISDPGCLNSSPFSEGWVYAIEPANWLKETLQLEIPDKYRTWLSSELSRLREFLALALQQNSLEYQHVVLQDGGTIKDGVLEEMSPKIWEDFQTSFLDVNR